MDFGCSHKKQVYDCNDVDKLSVQLEMCSGNYKECVKYAENAPAENIKAGDWVSGEVRGDELTFDEMINMIGELVIINYSTESMDAYKAVTLYKFIQGSSRRIICLDKPTNKPTSNDYCYFDERYMGKERTSYRAWRIKTSEKVSDVASAESAVQLPDTPADNAVFDYSELDSDTADRLQVITENVARVKQQYVFGMAEQVKKAHDLLANNKTGVFGKWCKFIGISDETARNLMNVSKLFGNISDEEQAKLENLPPTLLYAVAKDDKRGNNPEAVQAVLEGDITTHKDYIALKKQLEEAKQEALNLDQDLSDTYNDYLEENEKNQKLTRKNAELEKRVNSLEIENKNLEARTLEVKEIPEEEIDRRAVELANGMLRSKDAEFTERLKEMQAENRQLKNELSKAQSGGSIEEQLTEIYEQFHDKAKYALKDCATFISEGSFTDECRKKLINRFRDFVKLLDLYFEDLNINSNVVEEYREMGEEEFL